VFNNLTDAVTYNLEFDVARNLSYKKNSGTDAKFSEDQCQAGDVVVMELIVK